MFCKECGNEMSEKAVVCLKCGAQVGDFVGNGSKSRLVYILFAFFLGGLGIHNFYAGYFGRAISQLLITFLLGWLIIPLIFIFIWVVVEIFIITQDSKGVKFS